MNKSLIVLCLILSLVPPVSAEGPKTKLSVYFVGNSLTMSSTLDRVHGFFGQRGIDLQFGSQVSGGKSLQRHLNYKNEPAQKWLSWETSVPSGDTFTPHMNFYMADQKALRFGLYDRALAEYRWDAVVMQAYDSTLHGDMEAVSAFIGLARKKEPQTAFYIYQTWPSRPRKKTAGVMADKVSGAVQAEDIGYPALWEADYTATIDQTDRKTAGLNAASRDYYRELLKHIGEKMADLPQPVRLIPVGEILFVLDGKIKRNELPGLTELAQRDPSMLPGLRPETDFSKGVNVLYADPIHFNAPPHQKGVLGNFVSGTALFTVISGQNPVGLSAASYGLDDTRDAALIRAIQETIWQVVTNEPATGIKP